MCVAENRWAKWYTIEHKCLKSSPTSKFTEVSDKLPEEPSATLQCPGCCSTAASRQWEGQGGGRGCGLVGHRREQGWKDNAWETASSSFAALYQAC